MARGFHFPRRRMASFEASMAVRDLRKDRDRSDRSAFTQQHIEKARAELAKRSGKP